MKKGVEIIIVIAVVAIVVLSFSAVYLTNTNTPNHGKPFTAKQGLPMAQREARNWKPDARLTGAWTWEGPSPPWASDFGNSGLGDDSKGDGKSTFWIYDFLSGVEGVELHSLTVILRMNGAIELDERIWFHPVPVGDWDIDSDEAIDRIKETSESFPGEDVLQDPAVTIRYKLEDYEAEWWVDICDYSNDIRYLKTSTDAD